MTFVWKYTWCIDAAVYGLFINFVLVHSLYINKFTDVGKSQLREAAEKRNSDTTNYVRLGLGV